MKKHKHFIYIILVLLFSLLLLDNVNVEKLYNLKDGFYTNYSEVENVSKEGKFGRFVSLSLKDDELQTGSSNGGEGSVIFKLFGFIPIKKVDVKLLPEDEVFVCGVPIGLSVETDGAVVVSDVLVDTQHNQVIKNKVIKSGDIIKKINDVEIASIDDITTALNTNHDALANIEVIRDNKRKNLEVELLKDKDNHYKLGVWVKNDVSGIGTLTFVRKTDSSFGALGHPVTNAGSDTVVPIVEGDVYDCNIIGVSKGQRNQPGELRGVFLQKDSKGKISKNTPYGIFGKLNDYEGLVDTNVSLKIGGRLSVKPGKAKIISSVSGIREEYDIEIIKANFQSKSSDKSIVFRVTDKRLLDITGGIVQGMSGSPIVQDGKLVGAVTHVFLSDSTKGYGVYSDWMLEQL